jgi:tetratricopeptide (TPR) repeat protein
LVAALAALCVALARPHLLEQFAVESTSDEVSLLLSPEHTVVLSLGHREALADYLFANALVRYGLSFQEKKRFEATYKYLDTITTLAPTYDRPYLYADTLLTMRPTPAVLQDFFDAKHLHERGMDALPFHTELWSVAGQFSAFLVQQHLPPERRKEFKLAGASYMARACELASNNANIPYHCIAAARILNRAGHREAMIRMLTRTLAVNDDPEIRRLALGYLELAVNERERELHSQRLEQIDAVWQQSLPHVSRIMMSLLGPGPDIWRCSGAEASQKKGCETTWRAWGEARDRSEG